MDLSKEQQSALVADLDLRLRSEVELGPLLVGPAPAWYGPLLSSLILATGDAHVLYLSACVVDGGEFSAVIALFTQKLYVRATVPSDSGADEPMVTVLPRSSLTSMRLTSDHDSLREEAFESWPGTITLTLTFGADLAVSLPLGASGLPAWRAELHSLVDTSRGALQQ